MTTKAKGVYAPDQSLYITLTDGSGNLVTPGAGTGTVTSVSVTTANGVSGTVATATTTPAITVALGDITPTTVNVSGAGYQKGGTTILKSDNSLNSVFVGGTTGNLTASGNLNTGIGFVAMPSITTGSQNTGAGYTALLGVTTGANNTAVGSGAGGGITTGIYNTCIGSTAGGGIVAGNYNTVLGCNIPSQGDISGNIILGDGVGNIRARHDAANWTLSGNLISTGTVKTLTTTVAGLPTAGTVGQRAFVTDGSTTLILGLGLTVAGGGANKVPVYDDGTNWKVG